jgi:hypothetical protein
MKVVCWSVATMMFSLLVVSATLGQPGQPRSISRLALSDLDAKFSEAEALVIVVDATNGDVNHPGGALGAIRDAADKEEYWPIPLIHGVALRARKADVRRLLSEPTKYTVWLIGTSDAMLYIRIVRAIDWATENQPPATVLNLSLAPEDSVDDGRSGQLDPLSMVSLEASKKGTVLVVAAGNAGPRPGSTTRWCRLPWVICVGALDGASGKVAGFSGRGLPGDATTWPTVVAPGVDVIGQRSRDVARPAQLTDDERRVGKARGLPDGYWVTHVVASGTSFAAPIVSSAVAQVKHYLACARAKGVESFTLQMPWDATTKPDPRFWRFRLAGDLKKVGDHVEVTYPTEERPGLVKQILIDIAQPQGDRAPEAQGAGYVGDDTALALFGQFGKRSVSLMPLKVL